ncbi:hypothetical protein E3P81_02462 [Wallemia ichthyophaga]|nr:hypothetical protein E3P97_02545 [Wallemia ichthyophaga]TIB31687.1 hypothetical protein E3P85_02186 [Wallemia ichthyophaga]TIB46037.1 hypothetical protein E3P82_02462 [Wallemia ichthyophaga]TIB49719.1 hypothetical protein E3P81_02462 [Wallemia ichthyophaga]TIB52857.1 hypothetical protein E3P80_02463 [Wallemia ichthyophaga]
MAPVSIFKKPGAQKFQLVHRSQRDEGRDPSRDEGVLKRVEKGSEQANNSNNGNKNNKGKAGDAANFGIYYDDTQYDYTQHLRTIGGQDAYGDELDSVLIAAPANDAKSAKKGFMLKQQQEEEHQQAMLKAYESQTAIPLELQGFNPDMDPALRQTLEALEDDAYLEDDPGADELDELDDLNVAQESRNTQDADTINSQWLDGLVSGGVRGSDEIVDFGPDEEEDPAITARKERERAEYERAKAAGEDLTPFHTSDWMERFKQFKLASKQEPQDGAASDDDELPSEVDTNEPSQMSDKSDYRSEGADTVGSLRSGIGAARTRRKLRKAGSDASGYSMSSSSMFRNDGLQSLDAQFDRIEEEYNSEDDDNPDDDDDDDEDFDPTSELNVTSREDFDTILDDFLDNYEVIGGKVKQKLEGETPLEKLNTMRLAMADLAPRGEQLKRHSDAASKRVTSAHRIAEGEEEEDDSALPLPFDVDAKEDRMDAETILSTYTNTENHPKQIRSQDLLGRRRQKKVEHKTPEKHVAFAEKEDVAPVKKVQIVVDPQTGFPMEVVEGEQGDHGQSESEGESYHSDTLATPKKTTIARDRNETKEEKKARKQAAKSGKQSRRVEKKETKEAFAGERKSQQSKSANEKKRVDVEASMRL